MQVALIPPTSMLYMVAENPLHMVIPEGLKQSAYANFYRLMSLQATSTLMLDNGAFEAASPQGPLNNDQLIQMLFEYDIDKFVLPDFLGDADKSLLAAERFLHVWNLHQTVLAIKPTQFIAAVQGADEQQLKVCIEKYCQLEEDFEIPLTFGLPRWIADEMGRHTRLAMADWIANRAPHPIHLLGMCPDWPSEIQYHNELVTSMDTSAPFSWAAAGMRLGVDDRPVERPENYFNLDSRLVDEELAKRNVDTLWRWANVQEAPRRTV
jgi:hypothetical protein